MYVALADRICKQAYGMYELQKGVQGGAQLGSACMVLGAWPSLCSPPLASSSIYRSHAISMVAKSHANCDAM